MEEGRDPGIGKTEISTRSPPPPPYPRRVYKWWKCVRAPVPFAPFLPPGLYFPLSRSHFLSSSSLSLSLSLLTLHVHFFIPCCLSLGKTRPLSPTRFHILVRRSLARCQYSRSVFSTHKYTNKHFYNLRIVFFVRDCLIFTEFN